MQLYKIYHPLRFPGVILLPLIAIVAGIGVGVVANVISQFLYLPIVFPAAVASLGLIVYQKIKIYIKVPNRIWNAFCALLMGIMIVISYHYVSYYTEKQIAIQSLQKSYNVTKDRAEYGFHQYIKEETGHSGLLGFMLLSAKEGEEYSLFYMKFGMVLPTLHYTLQGIVLWLYWGVEALIIVISLSRFIYISSVLFNEKEGQWYSLYPFKRIGNVRLENSQKFLALLAADKFTQASKLIVSPEEVTHPTCEVSHYVMEKRMDGTKLLEVNQAKRRNSTTVDRTVLFRGELSTNQLSMLSPIAGK